MTTASFAQTTQLRVPHSYGNHTMPSSPVKYKTAKTTGGTVDMRIDPIGLMAQNRNATFGSTGTVRLSFTDIFADSLVKIADANTSRHVTTHMNGIVFDPKSISQDNSGQFNPLLSKYDSYTIDSLFIGGEYRRVSGPGVTDTLVVEIVWGDTTNNISFGLVSYQAPLDRFRGLVSPRISAATNVNTPGRTVKLSGTNRVIYKFEMHESDTTLINQTFGNSFPVKLPTALTVPANNVVAIGYTFASGMSYSLGDIYFSLDPVNKPQDINGFAAISYFQNPQPTTAANVGDFFLDYAPGKNTSFNVFEDQRYRTATGTAAQVAYNGLANGNIIELSIQALSTVSVEELSSKGFSLSQNAPNPFSSQTSIQYELAKGTRNVTFSVFDVTGRVMVEMPADGGIGVHAINVGPFAAGVYYYSLNVDGNVITKKMIVQN